MNIYGDMGNIIALKHRLTVRGIGVEYEAIGLATDGAAKQDFPVGDIYFMGGGQDNDMFKVFDDLVANKGEFLRAEVAAGKVFLLICGAFQLFGKYFLDASGRRIKGLGILPVETTSPGDQLADRCLGNLLSQIEPDLAREIKLAYNGALPSNTIVGFENHIGQTYFTDSTIRPLGKVIVGKGNNSKDRIEGARFKNVFGSYSHGSLLPKNPHIADLLIFLAMRNKNGVNFELSALNDHVEWLAHERMRDKLTASSGYSASFSG
jgi:CobQ-like glutamine amidotransferase family enzyme